MSKFKEEILDLASSTSLTNKEISTIVGCSPKTVLKYVGSYVIRCQKKDNLDDKMWEIQKTILLPDFHHPHCDNSLMDIIGEFIVDYNPDELVYMGDQVSLDSLSWFDRNKPLLKEGRRLIKDYDNFNKDILRSHENITRSDIRRTFIYGNHEYRIDRYVENHPELEGFIDIIRYLKLEERGYKIIKYNKVHKVGKLNIIHGYYWNQHHAKKTVEIFEGNVVYSHVHNPQMHAKLSPIDKNGYHMATSLPCLCNIKPDYKKNAPNRWINGFGIVEHIEATGYFNLYTIIINNNSFMYNGKYYGKRL